MGIVYKARDRELARLVALKTLRADLQTEPQQLARFRAEAKALAQLHHPNIVQVYEVGEHEGCPYIALEFVEGGNLATQFSSQLPARYQAARVVEVLARAIHAAHQANIIHRDLKPANVLVTLNGILKITDFGLAKQLGSSVLTTHSGAILGTPSYMAPEQVSGKGIGVSRRTDVYALGAILYELITGRPPFKERTAPETMLRVLNEEPLRPHEIQANVPRDLETICLKCLEKDPEKRYHSALALAEDLRRFQAERPIRAEERHILEHARRWSRRHAGLVGFVAGVLATAPLAIGLTWSIFVLCPLLLIACWWLSHMRLATKWGLTFLYFESWGLAWLSLKWLLVMQAALGIILILTIMGGHSLRRR
jgi:serine/threonine protein kinase